MAIDWSKLYEQPTPTAGNPSGGLFEGEGSAQPYSNLTYNMAGNNIVSDWENYQDEKQAEKDTFWQTVQTSSDFYGAQKPKHDAEFFRKLWQSTASDEAGVISPERQQIMDRFNIDPESPSYNQMQEYLEGEGMDPNRLWRKKITKGVKARAEKKVFQPGTEGTTWTPEDAQAEIRRLKATYSGEEHAWHGHDATSEAGKYWKDKPYDVGELESIAEWTPQVETAAATPAEYWDQAGLNEYYESILSGNTPVEGLMFDSPGQLVTTGAEGMPGSPAFNQEAIRKHFEELGLEAGQTPVYGETKLAGQYGKLMKEGISPEGGLLKTPAQGAQYGPNPVAMPEITRTAGTPGSMIQTAPAVEGVEAVYSGSKPGLLSSLTEGQAGVSTLGEQALQSPEMMELAEAGGVESAGFLETMGAAWPVLAVLAFGNALGRPNTTIGKAMGPQRNPNLWGKNK